LLGGEKEKRAVSEISWLPENNSKIVVSYANMKF